MRWKQAFYASKSVVSSNLFQVLDKTTGNYTYNLYRKGTALFDAVKFIFNVIKHAFSSFSFARRSRKLLLEL